MDNYLPSSESEAPYHQLIIPSSLDQLEKIEQAIEVVGKEWGLVEDDRDNLAIAVTELANNAIIHGNKLNYSKSVTISFYYADGNVRIYVKDCGGGFDPAHLDNPLAPENILKESGRGIFILKSIVDKVDFFINSNGTEVRISKTIGNHS